MNVVTRLHIRQGDKEIQVEGTKDDVNELALSWWDRIQSAPQISAARKSRRHPAASSAPSENGAVDINSLANSIKERDDFAVVERHVLHEKDGWNKIALILSMSDEAMTSGEVCRTLLALDVKADPGRVSNTMKDNASKLTTDGVRKKGATIRYKLTGKAKKDFIDWLARVEAKSATGVLVG